LIRIRAAQRGETQDHTVTYGFNSYPLVDLRNGPSATPSILSSSANVVGDTTGNATVKDDPTLYINAGGQLVIKRASSHSNTFTSMYTGEFYQRTGYSSIASFVSVSSDDTLFNTVGGVASDGGPINEMHFDVPASAHVGIVQMSWNTIGGNDTNENIGMGFAVVDLAAGTSAGSVTFIRASTPDLVSWDAVPLGTTFFGATDGAGNPLYQSNKNAGSFTDRYGETARFTLVNNADGSRTLVFYAENGGGTQNFRKYQGNAQISWLGNEPFQISGVPTTGTLSAGSPVAGGGWEIDFAQLPTLEYIPDSHDSAQIDLAFGLSSTGEVEEITVYVEPVVDPVVITASDALGYISSSIPLSIGSSSTVDLDGSETEPDPFTLTGVPTGVVLSSSAGSVVDNGGGSWTVTESALAGLQAQSPTAVTATVSVSGIQTDEFDLDADGAIEDGNNGLGVDEYDELVVTDTFVLEIRDVPTVTSQLSALNTPVISGTVQLASGETFTVTVNGVTYTNGDGNLIVNANGTWDLTIPAANAIPEGTYSVVAEIAHGSGASASDVTNSELIIDLTPPPAPGVTSQTTQDTTPLISGTTTVGGGYTLSVEVNGVTYVAGDGNLVDNGDGTWDLIIPAADVLADGLYQVVATLTEASGNSASDPGVDDLVVDTVAPPTPGVTSLVTNDTTPVVSGTAVVGVGDTLTVEVNGVIYTVGDGNLIDNGDGTWDLTIPAADSLAEANYDVTATVTDLAGNAAIDPSSAELTVDLTAPSAPTVTSGNGTWDLTIPAANAMVGGLYDVTATVTDAAGNTTSDATVGELTIDLTPPPIPTVSSQLTNNPTPIVSGTATVAAGDTLTVEVNGVVYSAGDGNLVDNGDGTWDLTIPATDSLADAAYEVTVTVTDPAGNASADTSASELVVDLTPPPAPGVTSQTTQDTTPLISGTTTVGVGLVLSVEVNGITYVAGDGNLVDNGDGTWDLTIPTGDILADGLYQVVAILTDAAGNSATDPGVDDLVVDTLAPPTPGVTSQVTNVITPTISGTAIVAAGDTLTVEVNGVVYTAGDGNLVDNGDGTWDLTIPAADALAEANYDVTASVTDLAGNTATDPSSAELTIDLTAPAAPTVVSQVTNNTTPVISGTNR